MEINDKILKFRTIGLVRLILILTFVLPASVACIAHNDYSGRLKIESVCSNKRKPFVGYHFLKCRNQMVGCLKNKLSYKSRNHVFGQNIDLHFKTQRSGFLNIKDKLTDFFHFVFMSIDKDVEKLTLI